MRLGFIGTGVITSAIVTGLCTLPESIGSILISPRNKEKAEELSRAYSSVEVAPSNQAVVDQSQVVLLAVLPQQRDEILSEMTFLPHHTVISLLAGVTSDEVTRLVAPAGRVVRAVPLPCVARHVGPIAVYPPDKIAGRVFGPLGTVVAVDKEPQLETLSIITALMAPYYALLETVVAWSGGQGVDPKQAADYTAAMFAALSVMSNEIENGDMAVLVRESMTPGGLNETAMQSLLAENGLEPWATALETVKQKIAKG